MLKHCELVIFLERFWGEVVTQGLAAEGNHVLWSTFYVDSHELWAVLDSSNDNLSLKSLAEWELNYLWRELVPGYHFVLDILLIFHQELNHANLNRLSFWLVDAFLIIGLNPHVRVSQDALSDDLLEILIGLELIAIEIVSWVDL